MTLALLESIIFNRITGPQSSPLTPATTIKSLGISNIKLYWIIIEEVPPSKRPHNRPIWAHCWRTLQDVLNSFPDAVTRETGNP
jgi:hypothetical protein